MFRSATLKLTAWYLGVVVVLAIIFSTIIYLISSHENSVRLENLQAAIVESARLPFPLADTLLQAQSEQANFQLFLMILYVNLVILVLGGAWSYFLARRTLGPIEKAHEAQSRFTSDASHELRTPLAAMKAELEMSLRQKTLDAGETRELLESNLEEVNKLIQLSEMLLELSRLENGKMVRKRLDFSKVVPKALKNYKSDSKRFEVELHPRLFVSGNELALVELVTILVDNALKYSKPKSKISLKTYRKAYQANFQITNTGPVIPESVLPNIFERFVRSDSSRTNSGQNGFGLGLAIAKKIADVHIGEMKVTSKDSTTTFTFSLPLNQPLRRTNGKITTK